MKVLIIDDEESIRFIIRNFLQSYQSQITIVGMASNGKEGLELCRQLTPDLIISDIRMPQMTGLDLLRAVREIDGKMLCVFVSAYTDFEYVQEAIRNGASGYVLKPIQKDEFLHTIDKTLRIWNKRKNDVNKLERLQRQIKKLTQEKSVNYMERDNEQDYSKSIKKTLLYIEEHYHEDISLETAAQHVFMNKNYLSALFRKETGSSFSKFLRDFRMKKAKILLRETDLSINEISEMTGFNTANYFIRVFKSEKMCTPIEYRLRKQNEKDGSS